MATVRDLADDGGALELHFNRCRIVTGLGGERPIRRLGLARTPRVVQRLARCRRCGAPGETRVLFPDPRLLHDRQALGAPLHGNLSGHSGSRSD